jgi:hypothetical protein
MRRFFAWQPLIGQSKLGWMDFTDHVHKSPPGQRSRMMNISSMDKMFGWKIAWRTWNSWSLTLSWSYAPQNYSRIATDKWSLAPGSVIRDEIIALHKTISVRRSRRIGKIARSTIGPAKLEHGSIQQNWHSMREHFKKLM